MINYRWIRKKNTYGINPHQEWDVLTDDGELLMHVRSNEDHLGNKWYMTDGEGVLTIWYPTKEAALKAYFMKGKKAIEKEC